MNWIKINQELKNVIETGKIIYGVNQSKKECLVGEPKLIIISSTIEPHNKELFLYYAKLLNIKILTHPENNIELGSVCGKPFGVSILTILDEGKSSIFEAIEDTADINDEKKIGKKVKKEEKKTKKEEVTKKKTVEKKEVTKKIKEEEKEVPITEDKMFKDIIKIKKK